MTLKENIVLPRFRKRLAQVNILIADQRTFSHAPIGRIHDAIYVWKAARKNARKYATPESLL
ncbi:MAG: hypothetical protein IPG64_28050 [Haliea sp.]|nr:hypothetical protein [Haliea sp.]